MKKVYFQDLQTGQGFYDDGVPMMKINYIQTMQGDTVVAVDTRGSTYLLEDVSCLVEIDGCEEKDIYLYEPYKERDKDNPYCYHGTKKIELKWLEEHPVSGRRISPYNSQDDIVIRIGDSIATKYGDTFTVESFTDSNQGVFVHFDNGDCLSSDRIVCNLSSISRAMMENYE